MMQTSTVQMPTDTGCAEFCEKSISRGGTVARCTALVLFELLVVIAIIALLTAMAGINLSGAVERARLERQAAQFINTLKLARDAAVQTNRRYAIILDIVEQTYTLRQIASLEMNVIPEDKAVLKTGSFNENCRLEYVIFDDLTDTRDWGDDMLELKAVLIVGRNGFQYGAKIVLSDSEGNFYSVIVDRLGGDIRIVPGDAELLRPKTKNEIFF